MFPRLTSSFEKHNWPKKYPQPLVDPPRARWAAPLHQQQQRRSCHCRKETARPPLVVRPPSGRYEAPTDEAFCRAMQWPHLVPLQPEVIQPSCSTQICDSCAEIEEGYLPFIPIPEAHLFNLAPHERNRISGRHLAKLVIRRNKTDFKFLSFTEGPNRPCRCLEEQFEEGIIVVKKFLSLRGAPSNLGYTFFICNLSFASSVWQSAFI